MNRFQSLLKRLSGGHPPTGPLTTSEATDAEELRQETALEDEDRIRRERGDAADDPISGSE